ncbi:MAG: hypothetical protein RLZ19_1165 [Actinomycetota bacterium]
MAGNEETARVLRGYADVWLSADLEKVLASYHDDIELHYMGTSPSLAPTSGVKRPSPRWAWPRPEPREF